MTLFSSGSFSSRNIVSSWFLPLVVLFVFSMDQASKVFISGYLSHDGSVTVIPQVFHLTLVHNTGIAFGIFWGASWPLVFLISFGIAILIYMAYRMRHETVVFRLSLGFILGGALGNLADRIVHGAVIDFLDFRVWPVFNLADSFITVGVSILIFTLITRKKV